MLYVAKLIFWNVVVGGILIHFGDDFVLRFFITFGIMAILAITLGIKTFLSIFYYLTYICKKIQDKPQGERRTQSELLIEFDQFQYKVKKDIADNLDVYLNEAKHMKMNTLNIGSMMMIPKSQAVSKIFNKKSKIISQNRSTLIPSQQILRPNKLKKDNLEVQNSASNIINQDSIKNRAPVTCKLFPYL